MTLAPIHTSRVSSNLRSFNLLATLRGSQRELLRVQNQLASGLKFERPSEDILAGAAALRIDRRLEVLAHVQNNLRDVNAALATGEQAMQDAVDLVQEAKSVALQMTGDTATPDERRSLAAVVDSLLEQLVAIGNRTHLGTYLFSGDYGGDLPFSIDAGGVLYRGNDGRLETILDTDLSHDTFTISGAEFFNAFSTAVKGVVDLNPIVTLSTRLVDLRGATGDGVDAGRIAVSDGVEQREIDLGGCDTIGDVIDKLNAEMPGTLTAALVNGVIRVASPVLPPPAITITDAGGGKTAVDLGIFSDDPVPAVLGDDLDPKLTPRTALTDVLGGAGLTLEDGIVIRNGGSSATISFAGAVTIEDVLNRINQAGVGVVARINETNDTIEVLSRVSGTDLRIEENGGGDAAALGIRSMDSATLLSGLNDGRGVDSVDGDDFRITTADGTQIDIDVDDLDLATATLQDLLDLINAQGGGAVTASLATVGNGIVITDNTSGPGTLRIEKLNLSPAIDTLGLSASSAGGSLNGLDVNPVRVDSPFTALLELRAALERDDTRSIGFAAERIERSLDHMLRVQGQLAAQAGAMLDRAVRIETEASGTQVLLSDVQDVDIADAAVRFQQVQTALQANLAASARILDLSLLDYVR